MNGLFRPYVESLTENDELRHVIDYLNEHHGAEMTMAGNPAQKRAKILRWIDENPGDYSNFQPENEQPQREVEDAVQEVDEQDLIDEQLLLELDEAKFYIGGILRQLYPDIDLDREFQEPRMTHGDDWRLSTRRGLDVIYMISTWLGNLRSIPEDPSRLKGEYENIARRRLRGFNRNQAFSRNCNTEQERTRHALREIALLRLWIARTLQIEEIDCETVAQAQTSQQLRDAVNEISQRHPSPLQRRMQEREEVVQDQRQAQEQDEIQEVPEIEEPEQVVTQAQLEQLEERVSERIEQNRNTILSQNVQFREQQSMLNELRGMQDSLHENQGRNAHDIARLGRKLDEFRQYSAETRNIASQASERAENVRQEAQNTLNRIDQLLGEQQQDES